MERLNAAKTGKVDRPIRVVQFGSGNFLRGFVDYMIDIANEKGLFDGDIVLLQPNSVGGTEKFRDQDCQYTVSLRGIVDGEAAVMNRQITSVREILGCVGDYDRYMELAELDSLRFVVSNTTEAGIVFDSADRFDLKPAKSFPGKLTQFLYRRYQAFGAAMDKGLVILPAELIDHNGAVLKSCVDRLTDLWGLEDGFKQWLDEACVFTSTLVDRIITGYPKDTEQEEWEKLGYEDRIMVTGEPFALWVIESEKEISKELPLDKAMADMPGMGVIYTNDHKPYKKRKVHILNGAHTSFVLASFLCGNDTVLESMNDSDIRGFLQKTIYEEVIPTLDLPRDELIDFAKAVESRFENPYVKHALLSISLNSVSKWRARCMPSLLAFAEKQGELPARLTFSLAALMAFYSGRELRGGKLIGYREGKADGPVPGYGQTVMVLDDIPAGHKMAIRDISCGEPVVKYGYPIGNACRDIRAGQWVHTHNVKTGLGELLEYSYEPVGREETTADVSRKDGSQSLIEYGEEGFILGVGAKMFTIAGPVIVYGVSASVVYGLIYWMTTLF